MSILSDTRDICDLLEKLCLELANKKDWSAHQKAEKVKSFFINRFADELTGDLEDGL